MAREVKIDVDFREVKSGVPDYLSAIEGVIPKLQHLEIGDYCVDNHIIIERKTLSDFAESIKDGRLFRQARRLANTSLPTLVLLEGSSKQLIRSGMSRESIQGALIALTLSFGLSLIRSRDAQESAMLLFYIAGQSIQAPQHTLPGNRRRPKGKRKTQLHILQGLPGVGASHAHHLLKHFGNVRNVMTANEEALFQVEGIGIKTARKIQWAIHEPQTAYRIS
jgi:ERCC4-type nuclease